jgi:hypothetical protein
LMLHLLEHFSPVQPSLHSPWHIPLLSQIVEHSLEHNGVFDTHIIQLYNHSSKNVNDKVHKHNVYSYVDHRNLGYVVLTSQFTKK